jgi:hypothetical protein
VIFDAWVSPPAGMLPEAKYRHVRYSFDADGNVEPTALETFTVPLDRLR